MDIVILFPVTYIYNDLSGYTAGMVRRTEEYTLTLLIRGEIRRGRCLSVYAPHVRNLKTKIKRLEGRRVREERDGKFFRETVVSCRPAGSDVRETCYQPDLAQI